MVSTSEIIFAWKIDHFICCRRLVLQVKHKQKIERVEM